MTPTSPKLRRHATRPAALALAAIMVALGIAPAATAQVPNGVDDLIDIASHTISEHPYPGSHWDPDYYDSREHADGVEKIYVSLGVLGSSGISCSGLGALSHVTVDPPVGGTETVVFGDDRDVPVDTGVNGRGRVCLGGAYADMPEQATTAWDVWITDAAWDVVLDATILQDDVFKVAGFARMDISYDYQTLGEDETPMEGYCHPESMNWPWNQEDAWWWWPDEAEPEEDPQYPQACGQPGVGTWSYRRAINNFGFCGRGVINTNTGYLDPWAEMNSNPALPGWLGERTKKDAYTTIFTDGIDLFLFDCNQGSGDLGDLYTDGVGVANMVTCSGGNPFPSVACFFDAPGGQSMCMQDIPEHSPAPGIVGTIGWHYFDSLYVCHEHAFHMDGVHDAPNTIAAENAPERSWPEELDDVPDPVKVGVGYGEVGTRWVAPWLWTTTDGQYGGDGKEVVGCHSARLFTIPQTTCRLLPLPFVPGPSRDVPLPGWSGGGGGGGAPQPPPPKPSDPQQPDEEGDGIGDLWADYWEILGLNDLDGDQLDNLGEFRWSLIPLCSDEFLPLDNLATQQNETGTKAPVSLYCLDYDQDGWQDGPEVAFWNDPGNDAMVGAVAVIDPDSTLDSDRDGKRNADDADSDNDGLTDGQENDHGSYPELQDSDCASGSTQCTRPSQSRYNDPQRLGSPGTGDGLPDAAEKAMWDEVGPNAWQTDYDGDGIAFNLLDPDADGDGLLDGEEVNQWGTKPHLEDTDRDGLLDGDEVHVYRTDPLQWDTDGDGMPDGYEFRYHLNPRLNDASLDQDVDDLSNLDEYRYKRPTAWDEDTMGAWTGGTNPVDADTEGDSLLDGAEALVHGTDAHHWDTDRDGLPDSFELQHAFDPLDASDAALDADADFFDQGNDGSIEQTHTNLQEYRYQRPAFWSEPGHGPWTLGTLPLVPDTDGDGALDGFEVYMGQDARIAANTDSDTDGDGLTWAEEVAADTNPSDADTDGDGLCDGSRGPNCRFPGMGSVGNMPGEEDYGSIPWDTDSDNDGRPDAWEAQKWDPTASGSAQDVDGDLLNGVIDADSDGDGLTDGDEYARLTDMGLTDTDTDGLTDGDEVRTHLTNPRDDDHDNDGLLDGEEITLHSTRPLVWDTDGDGLRDGSEVATYGTDPLLRDTDGDMLPDSWEVAKGTQARVADADKDTDADGLTNHREWSIDSHPSKADTDGDGLPDGYEDQHGLGVTWPSWFEDPDGDGAWNRGEHAAGTLPQVPDSDGDGRLDGWELTYRTDPLDVDTDKDGLGDGAEYDAWAAANYPWNSDPDGDLLQAMHDVDSDNDGLNDRDELVDTKTKPYDRDSDGDGLTDFDEVVTYGGQYDPNDADTDGDGQGDAMEIALADTNGDYDRDGLKNGAEGSYGTDPTDEDSDCDGVKDGPEYTYWGMAAPLLNSDWDGDGLLDGVELGTVGTPSQALYRTNPAAMDTDGDGLDDGQEARNNVKVTCNGPTASMSMQSGIPMMPPAPASASTPGLVVIDGFHFGYDDGWYVRGGYGVNLHLNDQLPPTATPEEVLAALDPPGLQSTQSMNGGPGVPGSNGKCTDPTMRDTDQDGIADLFELYGINNPYPGKYDSSGPEGNTDPCHADTDRDTLSDGKELNPSGWFTNPNSPDTDGDGGPDNIEDANGNGLPDIHYNAQTGAYGQATSGATETSPSDGDTDDDGIPDLRDEKPLNWDRDGDGLSDGLETGATEPAKINGAYVNALGVAHTTLGKDVFGLSDWETYQEFPTVHENLGSYGAGGLPITTRVDSADSDGDGIIDGLEDLNHNGIFGDVASIIGVNELSPSTQDANRDGVPDGLDSDRDGITDGRELLIYGFNTGQGFSYTFQDVINSWGGSFAEMKHDASNPFETDPRLPSTDADGILDGKDLLPTGNALMAFGFGAYRQINRIDPNGGGCNECGYKVDLGVSISLETPAGTYAFATEEITNWYTKNERTFNNIPSDETLKLLNEQTKPTSIAGRLDVVDQAVSLDLPENVDLLQRKDANVVLTLGAVDYDDLDSDDTIDISPVKNQGTFTKTMSLLAGPKAGLVEPIRIDEANGGADGVGKDDGHIKVSFGHNLLPHFLEPVLVGGLISAPAGKTCLGGSSCIV